MDLEAAAIEQVGPLLFGVAEDVGSGEQVVAQGVGEIGGLGVEGGDLAHPVGDLPGGGKALGPLGSDQTDIAEPLRHLSEAAPRRLRVADRVVARWRAHKPGEECPFYHRQLFDVLAEVHLGRSLQPIGVIAKKDGVDVALEDLVLGELVLQAQGVKRLQLLVAGVAGQAGEVLVLDHLLGDRAGALTGCIGGEVGQHRPHEAAQVHTVVEVVLVVLDGQQGLDHRFWHLVETDRLAVLTLEDGDHEAEAVVDDGALRQGLEVGQLDRSLVVGIGHQPQTRRHGEADAREKEGARQDDGYESKGPGQSVHVGRDASCRTSRVGITSPQTRRVRCPS